MPFHHHLSLAKIKLSVSHFTAPQLVTILNDFSSFHTKNIIMEEKKKLKLWLRCANTGKTLLQVCYLILVFSVSSATMLMFILTSWVLTGPRGSVGHLKLRLGHCADDCRPDANCAVMWCAENYFYPPSRFCFGPGAWWIRWWVLHGNDDLYRY